MSGLRGTGIVAGYGDRTVLHGIDLEVAPGEWVALIGPNGAGKSTLLKAIAGAVPSSGTRSLDGQDLGGLRRREVARRLAVVPQVPDIPGGITVLDYVLLGRTPYVRYWGWETAADVRRARDVIERLSLTDLAARPVVELSGGERQRAVLGRALAQDAGVLLLDEPTAALDIGHQQQVMELVDELRTEHGIAVLAAVHDLTLAAQYADRLVLMDGGVIVAGGAARSVLSSDILTRHYGASVTILHDERGRPVIAPSRPDGRAVAP
jgi:iron complex transport system ATP-binding protein